jgi:hypothetical protein
MLLPLQAFSRVRTHARGRFIDFLFASFHPLRSLVAFIDNFFFLTVFALYFFLSSIAWSYLSLFFFYRSFILFLINACLTLMEPVWLLQSIQA